MRRLCDDDDLPEPPQVRRLRLLVTTLMVVLILGMVIVVAAMVVRLGLLNAPAPTVPIAAEALALPQGHEVVSLGRGEGQVLVLTRAPDGTETLRAFDAVTGEQVSATPVTRE